MKNPEYALNDEAPLPEIATTKEGVRFYPRETKWKISSMTRTRTLDFSESERIASVLFVHAFKRAMIWSLENHGANTTYSRFDELVSFFSSKSADTPGLINSLSAADFLNYKASLLEEKRYVLSSLASNLRQWHQLGLKGLDADLMALLGEIRLKGMVKGKAVRLMCPIKGPFTEIELIALQQALNESFSLGKVSFRIFVLFWLMQALGARPIQIASMKVADFKVKYLADESPYYTIDVPRAKQQDVVNREEFKKRKLVQQIGELLQKYIAQLADEFSNSVHDFGDFPLFPRIGNTSFPDIPGFEMHANSTLLGGELSRVFKRLNVLSERTGGPINVNPYRFRYTLGTRAAEQGASELVIAELLDHSDTQQVGIYVAATPKMIERIDRAMAMQIAPLAQAFSGILIDTENEAIRGNDPRSRVIDPKIMGNLKPIGNCGKYGFCGLRAPISCYTCTNFQPWLDADHEKILLYLLGERERMLDEYGDKIAFTNDRTIYAVASVIQQIEIRKMASKN